MQPEKSATGVIKGYMQPMSSMDDVKRGLWESNGSKPQKNVDKNHQKLLQ